MPETDLLAPDLVAQARAMWQTAMWQQIVRYLRERRETLLGFADPVADMNALWVREGQLVELNRLLRGDAFLAEVIRAAQARRAAGTVEDEMPDVPPWMRTAGSSMVTS